MRNERSKAPKAQQNVQCAFAHTAVLRSIPVASQPMSFLSGACHPRAYDISASPSGAGGCFGISSDDSDPLSNASNKTPLSLLRMHWDHEPVCESPSTALRPPSPPLEEKDG